MKIFFKGLKKSPELQPETGNKKINQILQKMVLSATLSLASSLRNSSSEERYPSIFLFFCFILLFISIVVSLSIVLISVPFLMKYLIIPLQFSFQALSHERQGLPKQTVVLFSFDFGFFSISFHLENSLPLSKVIDLKISLKLSP